MGTKQDRIQKVLNVVIILVSSLGLYLNFKIVPIKNALLYFTIISNLFCLIYYLLNLIKFDKHNNSILSKIFNKGSLLVCLFITMVVYQAVLNDTSIYANNVLACNFVHLFVPILVIIDYILFDSKGTMNYKMPLYWLLLLIAYISFIFIYIFFGGTFINGDKYPYSFINIEEIGLFKTIINIVLVVIFYFLIGEILCFIDKKLKGRKIKWMK